MSTPVLRAINPSIRPAAVEYFKGLQTSIIKAFEALEPTARFTHTPWIKPAGEGMNGGGTMAMMRGEVFEKVGVNFSQVHGTFSERFRNEIPGGTESGGAFWASGVSVVAHMANPFVPAVHFNVRRIETSRSWFGGGLDLTPTFPFEEDTTHFHQTLERVCESHFPGSYATYKKACAEYFYLPHRHEERGVGGVFYDYLNTGDEEADFRFTQAIGQSLTQAFLPLVEKRRHTPFTAEDRQQQRFKRGRYVEFNLLYDRGTRFGLQTGGNTEAILMSLPPEASW